MSEIKVPDICVGALGDYSGGGGESQICNPEQIWIFYPLLVDSRCNTSEIVLEKLNSVGLEMSTVHGF